MTLTLSKKIVEFLKAEAPRHHRQYQRMIRRLLDAYVKRQSQELLPRPPRIASGRAARKRSVA